ncbi:hypothetical protein [Rubricoccus marinus]|uniref:Uncharacterized protein n=1 Tax=Rubricoccus marinus TaxID=716817 RepID=A0A259TZM4_9BACT|nr:hypothetical protein [Rubricoccus marinus]OZC03209.1 hypothetical protein BSZ36_09615 [Rubricoccus marinus]
MPAFLATALLFMLAIGGCRADAAPDDSDAPEVTLQDFQRVAGTPVLTADLGARVTSESSRGRSSYSDPSGATVNVLFYDTEARQGRWLFPSNAARILDRRDVTAGETDTRAVVYTVVARDTDGDEQLTARDERSLVVVSPDGTGRRTLVERFDSDLGDFRVSPEAVVFTYAFEGQPAAVELNLADLSSRAVALPRVPGVDA